MRNKPSITIEQGSWQPVIGDLVSKRDHHLSSTIDNFSAELAKKFAMGFTVIKIVGPSVYKVTKEGKTFTVHLKDLKPFYEKNPLKSDHVQPDPELDEPL